MENSFIPDAIELVSKAIAADNENDYEKALALYRDALARFTMGLKYEKNEARKKLILERVVRFPPDNLDRSCLLFMSIRHLGHLLTDIDLVPNRRAT